MSEGTSVRPGPELWPFFEERHRALATQAAPHAHALEGNLDARSVVAAMAAAGFTTYLVPEANGGAAVGHPEDASHLDVRSLVLLREQLGRWSPLADSIFAVQGLGSYPLSLAGTEAQRARWLPGILDGTTIAAFGLTEPEAGSDVASMRTHAVSDEEGWTLTGTKHFISNVPLADYHVVFATVEPGSGRRGITAFLVPADAPGLTLEAQDIGLHHPIGRLVMDGCQLPHDALIGVEGQGWEIAMRTLDSFRITVGAAACGMAGRALDEALAHVADREQFGAPLSKQQLVRGALADMATELEASRLLVAKAAWTRDRAEAGRVALDTAMAKMYATEAAFGIVDRAVQLHGGVGMLSDSVVGQLYREVRPLRIYEGTTEIQKVIIASGLLRALRAVRGSH